MCVFKREDGINDLRGQMTCPTSHSQFLEV